MTDALVDAVRLDLPRVLASRQVPDPRRPSPVRERDRAPRAECRARRRHGVDAASLERLRRLRTDPPQRPHRQRPEESVGAGLGHDEEAIGLAQRGGDLRHVLGRRDADAADEAGLVEHPALERMRDDSGAPEQSSRAPNIEERLIDRERLDDRRHVVEDRHDLRGLFEESAEIGRDDDRGRAEPQRLTDRHRGAHAEPTRFVGRARDDRAAVRGADDDRLALQRRIVEHRDGRVERIHVHMQDAGARVVGTLRRGLPARPVAAPHVPILSSPADTRLHPARLHPCTDTAPTTRSLGAPLQSRVQDSAGRSTGRRAPARARGPVRRPPGPSSPS